MAKGTTKSNGQKHLNDKFYTRPQVALWCLEQIPDGLDSYDTTIEPSAGSGAFSDHVPGCLAFDVYPESDGVIEQDWFTYSRTRNDNDRVLVFGNPPFGQQNSLAVKFINHAAQFADTIAFVLPRSFKKPSVQNRLHPNFHLALELDLPKNSFTLNGEAYDVPCVFQVWEYRAHALRAKHVSTTPEGFTYVKRSGNNPTPHISIQRIGGNAGKASVDWQAKSESSHYFIALNEALDMEEINEVVSLLNAIRYPSRDHSVGPRSISKDDVARALNSILKG